MRPYDVVIPTQRSWNAHMKLFVIFVIHNSMFMIITSEYYKYKNWQIFRKNYNTYIEAPSLHERLLKI